MRGRFRRWLRAHTGYEYRSAACPGSLILLLFGSLARPVVSVSPLAGSSVRSLSASRMRVQIGSDLPTRMDERVAFARQPGAW